MGFWNLKELKLEEFQTGMWSKIESGSNLTMAFIKLSADKEGTNHTHPFDQCGIVVEGEIEMSIADEKKLLKPMEAYFIPSGIAHNWKTFTSTAKILDVVFKPS